MGGGKPVRSTGRHPSAAALGSGVWQGRGPCTHAQRGSFPGSLAALCYPEHGIPWQALQAGGVPATWSNAQYALGTLRGGITLRRANGTL